VNAVSVHHGGLCNYRGSSDRWRRNIRRSLRLIKLGLVKLCDLRVERLFCIPSYDVDLGTSGGSDDGGKDAFHKGCRHEPGVAALGQELEREFSTEHSRTEIHDHHDAIAVIGCSYGLGNAYGVSSEAIIRCTGRDFNARG
jgi:hypothetical protein